MAQVSFQSHSVYELASGNSRALIAPNFGARLLRWTIGEQEIIYWPADADWSSGESIVHTRGGNPILFPFVARHYVDGILGQWRDETGTIRHLPMHGFARDMAFDVVEAASGVLRMRLKSSAATRQMYPFDFVFDVIYELSESSLQATFEATNAGSDPLPYYAGHHFYFSIPRNERKEWDIILPCARWGLKDQEKETIFHAARKTQMNLDDDELVDRFHLDFSPPKATLKHRSSGREIAIELGGEYSAPWYDVTTWTQSKDSDFFCVEPWLGLPDAIHSGLGLRWIESGQSEKAVCRIVANG